MNNFCYFILAIISLTTNIELYAALPPDSFLHRIKRFNPFLTDTKDIDTIESKPANPVLPVPQEDLISPSIPFKYFVFVFIILLFFILYIIYKYNILRIGRTVVRLEADMTTLTARLNVQMNDLQIGTLSNDNTSQHQQEEALTSGNDNINIIELENEPQHSSAPIEEITMNQDQRILFSTSEIGFSQELAPHENVPYLNEEEDFYDVQEYPLQEGHLIETQMLSESMEDRLA